MIKNIGLIITVLFSIISCNQNKIAVVDNQKLFLEFIMTKELQKELEDYSKQSTSDLEKIKHQILILENRIDSIDIKEQGSITSRLSYLMEVFEQRSEIYQDSTVAMVNRSDLKIWRRIHEYTNQYAKANGIDLIIKNKDEFDLLYSNGNMDITEDLIPFINRKYEGL